MTENINYKLEIFEGPLDLLLSLISKNEIDIYNIPISLIFDQYMDYIDKMRELNMDIASSFIVMASELMLIKSRMLLPKPKAQGEEEDPRDDLVTLLLQYKEAKECAKDLSERWSVYSGRYIKETDEVLVDKNYVGDQETSYLLAALERILTRIKLEEQARNEESVVNLNSIVRTKPASVALRITFIVDVLLDRDHILFDDLMMMSKTRSELVASFIALLSLVSAQKVGVRFDDPRNPMITLKDADVGDVETDIM